MQNVAVPALDDELARQVLPFLNCRSDAPTLRTLNRLIRAYIHKVPWESVFRIIKRHNTRDANECPRLANEFWHDAMAFGGGGTCYENNWAFMTLLSALGYTGYMTVNDLGADHSNHAAGIIVLHGQRYVVDVSIPIPCALRIDPSAATRRPSSLHTFIVAPCGDQRYQIDRTRHSKRHVYVLIDEPVAPGDFLRVMANDYGPAGQFLEDVIILKMIDGRIWRYNAGEHRYRIESFGVDGRKQMELPPKSLAVRLGAYFGMAPVKVAEALEYMQRWDQLSALLR